MRKAITIIVTTTVILGVLLGLMFMTKQETYCFGEICPKNGETDPYYMFRPRFLCEPLGGEEVWESGHEEYVGCRARK